MIATERAVSQQLLESASVKQQLAQQLAGEIVRAAEMTFQALRAGSTIALCGNGGSAADAQHLAAELVGRFERERRAFSAIALTTDTSILTAVGNDYGFDEVFARQVEALLNEGDVLVAMSTSGSSANCVKAVERAGGMGVHTIGMTGRDGGRLAELCDLCLPVPHTNTARIQEGHITIGHIVCGIVERGLKQQAGDEK